MVTGVARSNTWRLRIAAKSSVLPGFSARRFLQRPAGQAAAKIAPNRRRLPPNRPVKQEAESVWCRLARISRRTRSDRSPFRSNADDLFACSLQALRSHRDQSGTLRRSPMSATEVATIIKLQPTARAYRIIPLCTRGRSICLQQTEPIASQAVSYYCFIPRPPAPCAPPAPYGPGSAPAALAPYFPLGRLQNGLIKKTTS